MDVASSLRLHGRETARRQLGDWLLSVNRYERGSSLPSHAHEAPYAAVVVTGGYEETCAGRAWQCTAGSIVVHPSGHRHADRFAAATTCLNVSGGRFESGGVIPPAVAGRIGSQLRQEFLRPDDLSAEIVGALMLELDAHSRRSSGEDRVPLWLRDARRMLETHPHQPHTVTTLAAALGVHPTHLARSFRRYYGVTAGEMLRAQRIERARAWLEAGRSIADIAAELGFADQSHLTRLFRKATGMTPAAFRRMARAGVC